MEDPEKGAWTIDETQKLAGSKIKQLRNMAV